MIYIFDKFSRLPIVFVIKRQFFLNLWCFGKEKKKKKETGGAGGPGRAIAHFGSSIATGFL